MTNLKRFLPQFSAIVIFIIVTAFFFSPLIFGGKVVSQGDIDRFAGASQEIVKFREKTGTEPLWTNSMFGGMPAYQISTLYPNNYVQYANKVLMGIMKSPAPIILIGMICFYFLLVTMKVDPWVSVAGAIAYGLSSYLIVIIQAGHNTQAIAVAYMPSVVMGMLITMQGRLLLGGALTALGLALEIYSNHLQVTYYLVFLLVFIGIGEAIRLFRAGDLKYFAKATGVLLIAAFVAVLPNLTSLYLTEEYGKYSTRGKSDITIDSLDQTKTSGLPIEYATQWSYGKGETMTLLIPDYCGGASERIKDYAPSALDAVSPDFQKSIGENGAYFGGQPFTSGPVYVGAIMCFLAFLALFIVKDMIKWPLFAVTVLAIMLAWGHNFESLTEFFFHHVPAYNKFRAVYMILVIAQLTVPLLAMLAVKEIMTDPAGVKSRIRMFYIPAIFIGGLCLLTYATGPSGSTVSDSETKQITDAIVKQGGTQNDAGNYISELENARIAIVKGDAIRSFFFVLLTAAILWFYLRKPFGVLPLAGGLSLLVLIDMFGVGHRYLNDSHYEAPHKSAVVQETSADEFILKDPDPDYRVLNLSVSPWQDASTSYYHKSIGGYHGAKLKRIQELYENVMEQQTNRINSGFQIAARDTTGHFDSIMNTVLSHLSSLNMLNTKYIIYNPDNAGVLVNKNACGSAWFVSELEWVKNADAEIKSIENLNPKKTAVVDQLFKDKLNGITPKYDPAASIKLTSYAPNDLKYESDASSDQLAVFSEIYYDKGWNAYIDGKPVDHVRADFVLRAMKVPAGKHQIEFKFEPSFYFTGEKIALAGSLLLLIFVGGGIYLDARKNKENTAKKAA